MDCKGQLLYECISDDLPWLRRATIPGLGKEQGSKKREVERTHETLCVSHCWVCEAKRQSTCPESLVPQKAREDFFMLDVSKLLTIREFTQACHDFVSALEENEQSAKFALHLCPYMKHANDISWSVYAQMQHIADTVDKTHHPVPSSRCLGQQLQLQDTLAVTLAQILKRLSDRRPNDDLPSIIEHISLASSGFERVLSQTLWSLAQEFATLWAAHCKQHKKQWEINALGPLKKTGWDKFRPTPLSAEERENLSKEEIWQREDKEMVADAQDVVSKIQLTEADRASYSPPHVHDPGTVDPRLMALWDMKFVDICFPLLRESLFTSLCRLSARSSSPRYLIDAVSELETILQRTPGILDEMLDKDAPPKAVDKKMLHDARRFVGSQTKHPGDPNAPHDDKEQHFLRMLFQRFELPEGPLTRAMANTLRLHHELDWLHQEANKGFPLYSETMPSLNYVTQFEAFDKAVDAYNTGEWLRSTGAPDTLMDTNTSPRGRFFLACSVEELRYRRRTAQIAVNERVPLKPHLEIMTYQQLRDYNMRLSRLLVVGREKRDRAQYTKLAEKMYALQGAHEAGEVESWLQKMCADFPGTSTETTPDYMEDTAKYFAGLDPAYRKLLNLLWNHPYRHTYLNKLARAKWQVAKPQTALSTIFFRLWDARHSWIKVLHILAILCVGQRTMEINPVVSTKVWEELQTSDLTNPKVLQSCWETALEHATNQGKLWRFIRDVARFYRKTVVPASSSSTKPAAALISSFRAIWEDLPESLVYVESPVMTTMLWPRNINIVYDAEKIRETKAAIKEYFAAHPQWQQFPNPENMDTVDPSEITTMPKEDDQEENMEESNLVFERAISTDASLSGMEDDENAEALNDPVVQKILQSLNKTPRSKGKKTETKAPASVQVESPHEEAVLEKEDGLEKRLHKPEDIVINIASWAWLHPKSLEYQDRLRKALMPPKSILSFTSPSKTRKRRASLLSYKADVENDVTEWPHQGDGDFQRTAKAMDRAIDPRGSRVKRLARELKATRSEKDETAFSHSLTRVAYPPVHDGDPSFVDKRALEIIKREAPLQFDRLRRLKRNRGILRRFREAPDQTRELEDAYDLARAPRRPRRRINTPTQTQPLPVDTLST